MKGKLKLPQIHIPHTNLKKSPDNFEPASGSDNRRDVEKENQRRRAQGGSTSAPVDGGDAESTESQPRAAPNKPAPHFSWRSVGSWDADVSSDKLKALHVTKKIEDYVLDHFYGDWFYNTVLPVGVCFFAYSFARFGFSFLWLPVVLMCAASVYRAEFRRFNRDIRDDMQRIHSTNRLEDELETMEWLNSFLAKFWVIYMPALSEMVLFQGNEVMKDQAPGFGIEAISLAEFTLGSKAPRVDSIKSYTRKGKDHIEMDWAFLFTPNDTDDMTKNEIRKKINPKVALGVTVGKAFISKLLPILVEDMSFTGRMNIKLKLTDSFPHVKMVSVQFLEPPIIDYALKPVGGDTFGLDIMSLIPGLSSFVNGIIHMTLRPMLYAPNSLDIDVEEIMSEQLNDLVGLVVVNVKRIVDLKSTSDITEFNPYVELKVSNNAAISEKTSVKKDTDNPVWLEKKYIMVNSLENNQLTFNVFHLLPKKLEDTPLGIVTVPLVDLLQENTQLGVSKNIVELGKVVGKLEYDLRWYETLKPMVMEDGRKQEILDTETGIMKLSVIGASDLDLSKSVVGLLNPYAEVYINNQLIRTSRKLKKTNEPSFGVTFESLVTNQSQTQVQVIVKDSAEDAIVGRLDANLQDLLFESSRGQDWVLAPCVTPGGRPAQFRIGAKWKALGLQDEDAELTRGPPIGGLRLHIRAAQGLVNLESVGDVDPYVRVVQNGKLKGKTVTIADTSDPYFNLVFFLPVANEHQHVLLEILDAEAEGKDRHLGSCAITIKDFLKKNNDGHYMAYDGNDEVIEQPVLYNGKDHGNMTYSVTFYPTLPVYTRSQLDNLDEIEKEKERQKELEEKRVQREEELMKKHPDEYEWIEMQEDNLPEPEKLDIPLSKAIKYRSGTIIVLILSGRFSKPDFYVHTLFDDHVYPSNVSSKAETRDLTVATTAEAFIRDLPNSNIVLRLSRKAEVEDQADVIAEKILPTLQVLEKLYRRPLTVHVGDKNTLKIQAEFIPSAVKLAPLDTVLDVGRVKLDILSASNLRSVDTNGKLDPLCVVKLDGVEIHRTVKRRRTLDPLWNDAIYFQMLSRSRQVLLLEVYDWDLTHPDELLGSANIDLSTIPPNTSVPFQVDLDTQGQLLLRVSFGPEYVRPKLLKKRGLQIDPGSVVGAPLKVVGGTAELATSAVGSGVGFVSDEMHKVGHKFKVLGRKKKDDGRDSPSAKNSMSTDREDQSTQDAVLVHGSTKVSTRSTHKGSNKGSKEPSPEEEGENDLLLQHLSAKLELQNDDQELHETTKNKQTAPSAEEQIRENRPPSIENALPNMAPDLLPPPQRPNQHSDLALVASSMWAGAVPGRANIISAQGYSASSLDVKATVTTLAKTKDVHKTRGCKPVNGVVQWNEPFTFQAPPEAIMSFVVREHHKFGKSKFLGSAELRLQDVVGTDAVHTLSAGDGQLSVMLRYVPPEAV